MRGSPGNRQSGYALLLMLLALMGIGGAVMVGYTQGAKKDAENARYDQNQELLEEAKQALLMYAYNYPTDNPGRGPGRLPCPDTGVVGAGGINGMPNSSFNCVSGVPQVGRFPNLDPDLNLYSNINTRRTDATGEDLWYAVSSSFANSRPPPPALDVINSDTTGSMTLFDQSGNLVYDGAATGIAAVIIAPGPITRRDENDDGTYEYTQLRGTPAQRIDPRNYLDTAPGGFDNSRFNNNANNNVDGFILGPVYDVNVNDFVVNDQLIIITADEVIEFAEKAVLSAYHDAIDNYQQNIWVLAAANYRYPWLDVYNDPSPLTAFDADIPAVAPTSVIGRLPSIFANYFVVNDNDSQQFISEMNFSVDVDSHTVEARALASVAPDVFFTANGDLSSSFNGGVSFTGYVWDGHLVNAPTLPNDGVWEACPYALGNADDCNQDVGGNFIGLGGITPGESDVWLQVRRVTFTFNGAAPFAFPFASRTPTLLGYTPPDPTNHAYVTAEYDSGVGINPAVIWSQANDFKDVFVEAPVGNNGVLTFDGADTITVGLRYYPELPRWAWSNRWHDMVQVAYSSALQPGGTGACIVGVDCLTLLGSPGVNNDKSALLILSGNENDLNPLNTALFDGAVGLVGAPNYLADDLGAIFEGQNSTPDLVFDLRPVNANDVILLLE